MNGTDPLFGRPLPEGSYRGGVMPFYDGSGRVQTKQPDPIDDADGLLLCRLQPQGGPGELRLTCGDCGVRVYADVRDPAWMTPVCPACARKVLEEAS